MSKTVKRNAIARKKIMPTEKKIGVAVICALVVIILAIITLMILDAYGLLYRAGKGTEIEPPEKASTEVHKDGDYSYVLLKDGTVMITNCTLPDDTVEINVPSYLGGYNVSAIGESAFALITEMRIINVPEGVTYIGKAVFFGALNAKLYLPSTLKQVDDGAMEGFDEPAGIYYAGTEEMWSKVEIGEKNAVLARVICSDDQK